MNELWCGDESLLRSYAAMLAKGPPAQMKMAVDAEASAFKPVDLGFTYLDPMAQMVGDVAVIRVSGPLIQGTAGWKRLFGYTGYEDIKAALVETASKAEARGVVLFMDSPGGSTTGVTSTAKLIREVNKLKPVGTFANCACSAGYWLASAAPHITAEQTSFIGSIGAIMQLENYAGLNEKLGVKVHVFKSGALKMAGNPNEEMTEEAKQHFQGLVDDMATMFYQTVAEHRGWSSEKVRKDFGDARSMLAPRALAYGLIDQVGTLGDAVKKVQDRIPASAAFKV